MLKLLFCVLSLIAAAETWKCLFVCKFDVILCLSIIIITFCCIFCSLNLIYIRLLRFPPIRRVSAKINLYFSCFCCLLLLHIWQRLVVQKFNKWLENICVKCIGIEFVCTFWLLFDVRKELRVRVRGDCAHTN